MSNKDNKNSFILGTIVGAAITTVGLGAKLLYTEKKNTKIKKELKKEKEFYTDLQEHLSSVDFENKTITKKEDDWGDSFGFGQDFFEDVPKKKAWIKIPFLNKSNNNSSEIEIVDNDLEEESFFDFDVIEGCEGIDNEDIQLNISDIEIPKKKRKRKKK